ncbi:MAG: hypothetical protein ACLFR0_03920 [Alphaproteobacteria bacterium]
MSDIIFAEGNTTPDKGLTIAKTKILERMEGPLQDVVENAAGSHANKEIYERALSKSLDLAQQWLEAVANGEQAGKPAPNVDADTISVLFGVVSCIYDDASLGRQNSSDLDSQRAAKLVACLQTLQRDCFAEPT